MLLLLGVRTTVLLLGVRPTVLLLLLLLLLLLVLGIRTMLEPVLLLAVRMKLKSFYIMYKGYVAA